MDRNQLSFEEGYKMHGSARNWILSAANYSEYLQIMFTVIHEIRQVAGTSHIQSQVKTIMKYQNLEDKLINLTLLNFETTSKKGGRFIIL